MILSTMILSKLFSSAVHVFGCGYAAPGSLGRCGHQLYEDGLVL